MEKLFKVLFGFLFCWIVIFIVSCYVSVGDIETLERVKYSGIMAVFAIVGYWLKIGDTKSAKKSVKKTSKELFVFEGEFGRKLIYRIQDNKIYNGMSNKYDYEIKGNKIYKALTSQWDFRIEGNRIYKGFDTKVKYKIVGNKVYAGEFGRKAMYRVSYSKNGN